METTKKRIIIRRCREPDLVVGDAVGFEARWCLDQIHKSMRDQDEAQDEMRLAIDAAERMGGRCDMCQRPSENGMTIDGGLAVCDDCMEGEYVHA